jgi:hypothetical protein
MWEMIPDCATTHLLEMLPVGSLPDNLKVARDSEKCPQPTRQWMVVVCSGIGIDKSPEHHGPINWVWVRPGKISNSGEVLKHAVDSLSMPTLGGDAKTAYESAHPHNILRKYEDAEVGPGRSWWPTHKQCAKKPDPCSKWLFQ